MKTPAKIAVIALIAIIVAAIGAYAYLNMPKQENPQPSTHNIHRNNTIFSKRNNNTSLRNLQLHIRQFSDVHAAPNRLQI